MSLSDTPGYSALCAAEDRAAAYAADCARLAAALEAAETRARRAEAERDEARRERETLRGALYRLVDASQRARRAQDGVLSMPDMISDEVMEAVLDANEDAQAGLIIYENDALAVLRAVPAPPAFDPLTARATGEEEP